MNVLRSALFSLLALFLLPLSLIAEGKSEDLKLGAIVSLSGDAAKKGRNWLQGAELAVEHLKSDGIEVELIIEDDGTSPKRVVSAFSKLATIDKVQGIVGGTWDFLAEAAFPMAERHKTPFVTPTNPVEVLSDAFRANPYAFTNGLSLSAEKRVIRRFLQKKKIRSVSLVYINVPYGVSHAELIKDLSKELELLIVSDRKVNYESFADDLRLAALQISKKTPDLVFLVTNYAGADMFAKELERLKLTPVVLMTQALDEAFKLSKSPTLYQRSYGVYPDITNLEFVRAFQRKFGHKPRDYAVSGYDALSFLAKALVQAEEVTKRGSPFRYPGITGEHLLPSSDGALVENTAVVMTTKDGRFEEYLR